MRSIYDSLKHFALILAMLLMTLNVFSKVPPITTILALNSQEGTTVTVPVTVTNFKGVANISLRLNYDPSKLTFQDVVLNSAISSAVTSVMRDPGNGKLMQFRLTYISAVDAPGITISTDGTTLFILHFKGVPSSNAQITFSTTPGDCDYSPSAPGTFNPTIRSGAGGNFSTYFINGGVTIKPIPVIIGSNTVCLGSTTTYFTQDGMTNYNWNVPKGNESIGGTSNSVSITWNRDVSDAQNVSVNYTDANFNTAKTPTLFPVTVGGKIIPLVTGPGNVCLNSTDNVYTTDAGMSNYRWSILGGEITSGGMTNTVSVNWKTSGSQYISVNYKPGTCVQTSNTIHNVSVNMEVATPTSISLLIGKEPTCQLTNYNTKTAYAAIPGNANSTNFVWSISNPDAGSMNPETGVLTWNMGFAKNVDIQVKAVGCNGVSGMYSKTVSITPAVGAPSPITFPVGTEPTCLIRATPTTNYGTSAKNSTGGYNWSISKPNAGTIDHTTGVMTWVNGFSGSVDIRVVAIGCNGPSIQVVRTVNITPAVGAPVITIPVDNLNTEPTCQIVNATTITNYFATATNSIGFNWSLSTENAGEINPTTGVMKWKSGFSGTVDIQATASGCSGLSPQTIHVVNINPTVSIPDQITIHKGINPTSKVVNENTITKYTTSAVNYNGGFIWSLNNVVLSSLDPNSEIVYTPGNPEDAGKIDAITGVMTWKKGFSGLVDIQVVANGCNGPSSIRSYRVNVALSPVSNFTADKL